MSSEDTTKLNELVLHADQLFDENKYQETISLLKEYEVSIFSALNQDEDAQNSYYQKFSYKSYTFTSSK